MASLYRGSTGDENDSDEHIIQGERPMLLKTKPHNSTFNGMPNTPLSGTHSQARHQIQT